MKHKNIRKDSTKNHVQKKNVSKIVSMAYKGKQLKIHQETSFLPEKSHFHK